MNSTYRLQIELEHAIRERRRLVTEGLDALGIDLDVRRRRHGPLHGIDVEQEGLRARNDGSLALPDAGGDSVEFCLVRLEEGADGDLVGVVAAVGRIAQRDLAR